MAGCNSGPQRRPAFPPPSRRCQHPHRKPEPAPTREPSREAGLPQPAPRGEQQAPDRRIAKHAQHRSCLKRETPGPKELLARGLEPAAIADAGRADRLAAATAEAGVEVRDQRLVIRAQLSALERAHEEDAPARTVRLVAGGEVGRTGGQAEPAMHAWIQRFVAGGHTFSPLTSYLSPLTSHSLPTPP